VSEVYRPHFGRDYNYVRNVDTIIDPMGISRAVYYIGDTSMYYSGFVFIQGIGFTSGLLRPSIPWGFNNDGKMHCFSFDDSTAFSIPYDVSSDSSEIWLFRDTTCKEQFFTGVSQQRKQSIQLYPNPVSNAAFIKTNSEPLQLKIINNLGQVCDATYSREDLETYKIQTENLPPGIYTVLLETINGPSYLRFQRE
jgi:Secretion system C-terminal sorting domain